MDADSVIKLWEASTWPSWLMVAFPSVILLGLELISLLTSLAFDAAPRIPVKGKHLDKLEGLDLAFIAFNKCSAVFFVYNTAQVIHASSTVYKSFDDLSLANTLGSFVAFYVFYDFFYVLFHHFLHLRSVYPYIHKHHHRQKAPSRGNSDAVNVHPFEFLVGEYLHLLTIYVVPCHMYTALFFILLGGILASLNHTRFDVNIPYIYSVKVHDVHHRLPESNYGQYTMLWDRVFGSYRSYGDNEKVIAD